MTSYARRFQIEAYGAGLALVGSSRPRSLMATRLALAVALVALPELANAQTVTGGASPATMLNNICTFILGTFGQTLAILGIIGIGMAWMFGRASMGVVAGVIGGIIIMFGASYLGATLTGGSTS